MLGIRPPGIWRPPPRRVSSPIIFKSLVTSVTCLQAVQSDLGITLNGGTVSAWADQSGNGKDYSQGTASKQPTYNAAALNGFPTLTFDGVDDSLVSTLNLPAPGTTPSFIWMVMKQITWTSTDRLFGATSNANVIAVFQTGVTPAISQFNAANVNNNAGAVLGSWVRGEVLFSNSTSDYQKYAATSVTGANAGNSSATGREIGSAANLLFGNLEIAALMYFNAAPNAGELSALSAAVTAKYGAGVLV